MNPDIKRRWINRLRSGADRQGSGALHRPAGTTASGAPELCCLGVLCEIALEDGIVTRELVGDAYHYADSRDPMDWGSGALPYAVARWAGLDSIDPVVKALHKTGNAPLSLLNDDVVVPYSFPILSQAIEVSL